MGTVFFLVEVKAQVKAVLHSALLALIAYSWAAAAEAGTIAKNQQAMVVMEAE